jgi:glutamate racemase
VEPSPESLLAGQAGSPVGIFDSGIGGLSVLQQIRTALPAEDLLYVADSGHVPYGAKTADYILRRSVALTEFLLGEDAKAVVIACNTATAAAAAHLRSRFPVPIVGMEPAVKPATAATRAGVVGVLATVGMLENARFAALLERFAAGTRVVAQGCPGLVEQVEAGDLAGSRTRSLVRQYTEPLISAGADVIVLGCTHYAFLRPLISEIAGSGMQLIETGAAVARQLRRVLKERSLLNARTGAGSERYWTTGDAVLAGRVMSSLLGRPVVPCQLTG